MTRLCCNGAGAMGYINGWDLDFWLVIWLRICFANCKRRGIYGFMTRWDRLGSSRKSHQAWPAYLLAMLYDKSYIDECHLEALQSFFQT